MDERDALRALKECRARLTRQETRTLAGQIRAGRAEDAMRGLARLLRERGRHDV